MSGKKPGQIVPTPVLPLVAPEEAAEQWQRFEVLKRARRADREL